MYNLISQVKIPKHDVPRYVTHRPVEKRIFWHEGKQVSRKVVRWGRKPRLAFSQWITLYVGSKLKITFVFIDYRLQRNKLVKNLAFYLQTFANNHQYWRYSSVCSWRFPVLNNSLFWTKLIYHNSPILQLINYSLINAITYRLMLK